MSGRIKERFSGVRKEVGTHWEGEGVGGRDYLFILFNV